MVGVENSCKVELESEMKAGSGRRSGFVDVGGADDNDNQLDLISLQSCFEIRSDPLVLLRNKFVIFH